jgi:hypothetical protein
MLAVLAASARLFAQTPSITGDSASGNSTLISSHGAKAGAAASPAPFSRLALSGGIGIGGINLQAAVEANRHINLRAVGNVFQYNINNLKINGGGGANGIKVSGNLNFATAALALDYYPFPNHGFRLSPGFTLYNQNQASATGVAAGGSSFTLNSQTYYSETANPLNVNASLGLNTHQQAFTFTTGWGNMLSRKGGHFSFPVDIGAIFTGAPTLNIALAGYACTSQSDAADSGPSCVNMATNATAQANLNSQVAKYRNDLNPLQVYPIFSFGVSYNFRIRASESTPAGPPPPAAQP